MAIDFKNEHKKFPEKPNVTSPGTAIFIGDSKYQKLSRWMISVKSISL